MELKKSLNPFSKKKRGKTIFIIVMLAYPVAHFLIFWIFVNFNSILLTFKKFVIFPTEEYPNTGWNFAGFANYKILWNNFKTNASFKKMLLNSLSYIPLNCLIALPIAIIASFFLFKRIPMSKFFRALFFFPSIVPLVVLALAFQSMLDPIYGLVPTTLAKLNITSPIWFGSAKMSQLSIYIFCIWSGLGYTTILLSSAMSRLPVELLEYGKLEGIKGFRELIVVYVPLIWPTITTLTVLGLMSVFNVALQPMFLTGNINKTIGLEIFSITQGGSNLEYAATLGLVCSLILAPIIMLIRFIMEKFFADVDF